MADFAGKKAPGGAYANHRRDTGRGRGSGSRHRARARGGGGGAAGDASGGGAGRVGAPRGRQGVERAGPGRRRPTAADARRARWGRAAGGQLDSHGHRRRGRAAARARRPATRGRAGEAHPGPQSLIAGTAPGLRMAVARRSHGQSAAHPGDDRRSLPGAAPRRRGPARRPGGPGGQEGAEGRGVEALPTGPGCCPRSRPDRPGGQTAPRDGAEGGLGAAVGLRGPLEADRAVRQHRRQRS